MSRIQARHFDLKINSRVSRRQSVGRGAEAVVMDAQNSLAWAEIDLKAIAYNYRQIQKLTAKNNIPGGADKKMPFIAGKHPPDILPVIKADAYGHGMLEVASALKDLGATFLGVSDVRDGVFLRRQGIRIPLLLLEASLPSFIPAIVDHDLIPTVCSPAFAALLNTHARGRKRRVEVHVKVDTGMGRLGVWHEDAIDFVRKVVALPHLSVTGLYTHFPVADTDREFTQHQVQLLYGLVKRLDQEGLVIPYVHAANSMGVGGYKTQMFSLVRPGLMLYGLYPSADLKEKITLKPAMAVKARVIFLKRLSSGRSVSYGHTFTAGNDMIVATLPIGYSDGFLRSLSNKAFALVNGQRCPVIGRVTMDQIIIDVSHVKSINVGTEVTLLGKDKREAISADDLAHQGNTISYEIICQLGNRLPRVYRR